MTAGFGWLARQEWYSLILARDLGPADLLRRLGGRAEEVVRRTAAEAEIEAGKAFPERQLVVRAGTRKPWAFAIEPYGGLGNSEMVWRISAGTAVVALSRDGKGNGFFSYAEDSRLVTGFDLFMPWMRHGVDPDRFLPAMRRIGLDPDRHPDGADSGLDLHVAGARLAARELAVRLDERAFLHAALASVAIPMPPLGPSTPPPQPTGPVLNLDDAEDREHFRQHGAQPGTVMRFTIRAKPPQRGPKAVSAGPVPMTSAPPPPGQEPKPIQWRLK